MAGSFPHEWKKRGRTQAFWLGPIGICNLTTPPDGRDYGGESSPVGSGQEVPADGYGGLAGEG
jgi:hypothetical protein